MATHLHQQHPPFRSTLNTVAGFASRLSIGRRQQRASTALLIVVLFFTVLTFISTRPPTTTLNIHPTTFYRRIYQPRRNSELGSDEVVRSPQDGLDVDGYDHTRPSRIGGPRANVRTRAPPPALIMDAEEELAAVIHFITLMHSNHIMDVDPNLPIPAELLLGFNTRSGDRARAELDNVVQNTWFEYPIIIFSETHSPRAREIKNIIATYKLLPAPAIFEVDSRSDVDTLTPLLFRLTGAASFPILLIGGKPAGTVDAIRAAHESGALRLQLGAAGAIIGGSEKKKKKKLIVQLSD
ncbi:hypothetical protein FRB97_009491 [Tulasnella sp. 331]|nr:hypothetical protein FRB97_009491 [Tulasnella sp. 331]